MATVQTASLAPMSIWRAPTTPEALRERGKRSLSGYLGIRITEIGPDFVRATMPVNEHTHQPFGVLHGGASVALAETVGSFFFQAEDGIRDLTVTGVQTCTLPI